jgi:ABC-type multidrug transport system ATPase subunit
MISPTSGTAYIDGQDIRSEMAAVRRTLSYCPQYDIVYAHMTIAEHMRFYGRLRNIAAADVAVYAAELFEKMNIDGASRQHASELSGGMRRKLSIAIAFMGAPTTVILDEPTSAVDPFSRRAIWDVLLAKRTSTTIVVSTHYMQEADLLADRIAIIAGGRLLAAGTSMYLKRRYGGGTCVNIAHGVRAIDANKMCAAVAKVVDVTLTKTSPLETQLCIVDKTVTAARMAVLAAFIEKKMKKFAIESFGVSESTMEQVFFNVTDAPGDTKMAVVAQEDDDKDLEPVLYAI